MSFILVKKTDFGTLLFSLYEKMKNTDIWEVTDQDYVEVEYDEDNRVQVTFRALGKTSEKALHVQEIWTADYIEFEE